MKNVAITLILILGLTACQKPAPVHTYQIELPNQEGTGYTWTYTMDKNDIVEESDYQYKSDHPDTEGGSGTASYTFKSLKPGTVTITFTYQRPWETENPPAQTKTYHLVVDKHLKMTEKKNR